MIEKKIVHPTRQGDQSKMLHDHDSQQLAEVDASEPDDAHVAANTGDGNETAASTPKKRRFARAMTLAARVVPPVIVIGLLALLAYLGHRNHWKIPAFSELSGNEKLAAAGWCEEHGVPEEICIACNADLMPKGELHGWCSEHGVAECVWEHPELAQLKQTPKVLQQDLERAQLSLETKGRPKNDPTCKMHLRRIQFASREAAEKAGVEIDLVSRGRVVETVVANGEIRYDPTLVTRLSSRAAGTVLRVVRNVGDRVNEGDLLALVDAASVGQAKAELLQAVAQLNLHDQTVQRVKALAVDRIVAGRRIQEAEAARDQAEGAARKAIQMLANLGLSISLEQVRGKGGNEIAKQLHFLGLPPSMSDQLDRQQTNANLVPLLAPRDGVIVTRDVVAGEVVDTTKLLFTVVDNQRMWLLVDVPLEDAKYVKVGQQIRFSPDGGSRTDDGEIIWISTRVDADTRTVKVRAEIPNFDGVLRDESFGVGEIVLRQEDDAIIAPKSAIHWEGCCHIAFVRDKGFFEEGSYKVFHTRMVRPGVTNGDDTEIIAGLFPGEVVVTEGSGVLRAELLKGNLGAG